MVIGIYDIVLWLIDWCGCYYGVLVVVLFLVNMYEVVVVVVLVVEYGVFLVL